MPLSQREAYLYFFFSSRRRHTRFDCDWSSDVCSSDLEAALLAVRERAVAVGGHHLDEAVERVVAGPKRRGMLLSPEGERRIAGYERSGERRGGEEGRSWGASEHSKKKRINAAVTVEE